MYCGKKSVQIPYPDFVNGFGRVQVGVRGGGGSGKKRGEGKGEGVVGESEK